MQQNRTQLRRGQAPVQRNQRSANPDARKEELGHLVPVTGDNSNALARADPLRAKERCPSVARGVELGVRLPDAARAID
jgi:hypothetical protein